MILPFLCDKFPRLARIAGRAVANKDADLFVSWQPCGNTVQDVDASASFGNVDDLIVLIVALEILVSLLLVHFLILVLEAHKISCRRSLSVVSQKKSWSLLNIINFPNPSTTIHLTFMSVSSLFASMYDIIVWIAFLDLSSVFMKVPLALNHEQIEHGTQCNVSYCEDISCSELQKHFHVIFCNVSIQHAYMARHLTLASLEAGSSDWAQGKIRLGSSSLISGAASWRLRFVCFQRNSAIARLLVWRQNVSFSSSSSSTWQDDPRLLLSCLRSHPLPPHLDHDVWDQLNKWRYSCSLSNISAIARTWLSVCVCESVKKTEEKSLRSNQHARRQCNSEKWKITKQIRKCTSTDLIMSCICTHSDLNELFHNKRTSC